MLLTIHDAAERLKLDYRQVLALVHAGRIKARNISTGTRPSWRVSPEAIAEYAGGADNVAAKDVFVPTASKLFG